jgi:hypothetical protein
LGKVNTLAPTQQGVYLSEIMCMETRGSGAHLWQRQLLEAGETPGLRLGNDIPNRCVGQADPSTSSPSHVTWMSQLLITIPSETAQVDGSCMRTPFQLLCLHPVKVPCDASNASLRLN